MSLLIKFLGFLFILHVSIACFITDCPMGLGKRYGKRSDLVSIDYNQHKWKYPQCPTCGPPHLQMGPDAFRCFGPKLCCSPTKGCLHGGSHGGARNCAYEDMNAAPCENHAKHCNSVGQAGQCVTKGICCNPKGKCTKDPVCNEITTTTNRKNSKILKFGKILLDLEKTIQDMSIAYPEQEDNFGLDNNDY